MAPGFLPVGMVLVGCGLEWYYGCTSRHSVATNSVDELKGGYLGGYVDPKI
jgi:hypothetical protein